MKKTYFFIQTGLKVHKTVLNSLNDSNLLPCTEETNKKWSKYGNRS